MNWNKENAEKLVGKTATLKKDFWGRIGRKVANAGDRFKITGVNVDGNGFIVSLNSDLGDGLELVKLNQIKSVSNLRVGAPVGNQNAAKKECKETTLHIACTPREKAGWVKSAKPGKLADWVRETLNKSAGK